MKIYTENIIPKVLECDHALQGASTIRTHLRSYSEA